MTPAANALMPRHNIRVRVRGHSMYASTWDRVAALLLWKYGMLERSEMSLVREMVKPGMTVVDVGANVGLYTLEFARQVGKDGKVYAFEPSPGEYATLHKNVLANGYHNVTLVRKACSDKNGSATFYLNEGNRGDNRLYDSKDGRKSVTVETVRLDGYLAGRKIDIIKMDIQGAELLALKGMRKTIEANKSIVLLCEFEPSLLRACGSTPEELLSLLRSLGFPFRYIDERTRTIRTATQERLMALARKEGYINLYLCRE
jgi:FkbM family methyltransferase